MTCVEMAQSVAVDEYRAARDAYLLADRKADEAWKRWFVKRQSGLSTNGAQAARLDNEASYLSADLANAQSGIFRFGIDPAEVDRIDGVKRDILY